MHLNAQFLTSPHRDFIPRRILAFDLFARNFLVVSTDNATALGMQPSDLTVLSDAITPFTAFMDANPEQLTRAQAATRIALRNTAISAIRMVVRRFFRTPGIPVDILISARLKPIDSIRTAHTNVNIGTSITVRPSIQGELRLQISNAETPDSNQRPFGMVGASLRWFIGETPPSQIEAFTDGNILATRNLMTLQFPGAQRGLRMWFRAAWVNRRGDIGVFCPPVRAIVP